MLSIIIRDDDKSLLIHTANKYLAYRTLRRIPTEYLFADLMIKANLMALFRSSFGVFTDDNHLLREP